MDNWPETSESLILRLNNQQDVAAWNEFLAIYRPVVLRMALRRGMQHADADDLAQLPGRYMGHFKDAPRALGEESEHRLVAAGSLRGRITLPDGNRKAVRFVHAE